MSAAISLPTSGLPAGDARDRLIIGLDVGSVEEARSRRYTVRASNRIWLNLPPARVWVYRRPA